MKYVVKINCQNEVPYVLFETTDLKRAFVFFNEVTDNENEIELAKYNEDDMLLDWREEELNSIGWDKDIWVTKKNSM